MTMSAPSQPTTGTTHRVLLTVSGVIEADLAGRIAHNVRPRPDYVELARAMDADIVDVAEARRRTGRLGRVVERVGGAGALLAWLCFRERNRYEAVFTDGEQVGLPLALLCRLTFRPRLAHVMVVHIMSVPKKSLLYRAFRLGRYVDTMIVYSSAQKRYITGTLGFPSDRVHLTPFTVDTSFFATGQVEPTPGAEPMICTAGLEFRDYGTLVEAARRLDVRVVIAAASPWSKRTGETDALDLPPNVVVCKLNFVDLRQLYADARIVVMPLHNVEFQAGVTTILEAMAMERPVVCTLTRGQTDIIVDRSTGVYVPPADAEALRGAIQRLLDDPAEGARIGAAAREYAVRDCDVSVYSDRLAGVVNAAIARRFPA
jgi:glycosyltransferase involved in cell wall biosynthesis